MAFNERFSLVYQCGLANVFDGVGKRVRQADYRSCELFCLGLMHAGVGVDIFHCDIAGDCASSRAAWRSGPGDLWWEQKCPPDSEVSA